MLIVAALIVTLAVLALAFEVRAARLVLQAHLEWWREAIKAHGFEL